MFFSQNKYWKNLICMAPTGGVKNKYMLWPQMGIHPNSLDLRSYTRSRLRSQNI